MTDKDKPPVEPKPIGKVGQDDLVQAAKAGGAFGVSELLIQTADAISLGVADEVAAYPFMTRLGLTVALRLSVALIEERGSIRAGLKFFAAYCRAKYRSWKEGRKQ